MDPIRRLAPLAALLSAAVLPAAHAQTGDGLDKVEYVPSKNYVGLLPGFYRPDASRGAGLHGFTLSALYGHEFTEWFSLEANSFGSFVTANTDAGAEFYQAGATLDVMFKPKGLRDYWVTPFAVGGVGAVYEERYALADSHTGITGNAGVGLLSKPIFGDTVQLRLDVRYVYDRVDGGKDDARANLGIQIPLGATKLRTVLAPAEPVQVVDTQVAEPEPVVPVSDTDGDGVPDTLDRCPGTPPGLKVDENGCAIPDQRIGLRGVNFKNDSAKLLPSSTEALDAAVQLLTTDRALRVEVAGHTDLHGSEKLNARLSQARADAVLKYLVDHGVEANRLNARGYGATQPIVAPEGGEGDREANRRVELRVLGY